MRRRSNLLVLLGLACFVLGLLAVYLFTKDDDDGGGSATADTVEVVVAAQDLAAGTNGEDIIRDQSFRLERIPRAALTSDDLTTPSQLSGTTLTLTFSSGERFRLSGLRSLGTSIRPPVPEGYEALTLETDFVAGGALTINPGDRVNVYLVYTEKVSVTRVDEATNAEVPAPPPYSTPRAELLLANVPVLAVQQGVAPFAGSQAGSTSGTASTATSTDTGLVFIVAVDTLDAEKVIFAQSSASVFLTRVRLDEDGNPPDPIDETPGQDFSTILVEEAQAALSRQQPIP